VEAGASVQVRDPLIRYARRGDVEKLLAQTGFLALTWREGVMIAVAFLLLWLAIRKEFEPLLLVPIGFGALMTNLPLNGLMNLPADGAPGGLFHYLFQGSSSRSSRRSSSSASGR
jgi:Na+-transporting methylmalonyl-CoA/oxaloacetate decarboxylase, beta subunit